MHIHTAFLVTAYRYFLFLYKILNGMDVLAKMLKGKYITNIKAYIRNSKLTTNVLVQYKMHALAVWVGICVLDTFAYPVQLT